MIYINSFLFAGLVCVIGQLMLDIFKLKPGEVTSLFVVIGSLLEFFDIYDVFVSKFGAGAMVVITSFGHLLTHSVYESMKSDGILGVFTGMFSLTSAGITSTILAAFFVSLVLKSRN